MYVDFAAQFANKEISFELMEKAKEKYEAKIKNKRPYRRNNRWNGNNKRRKGNNAKTQRQNKN